jgi:hypothetical protein
MTSGSDDTARAGDEMDDRDRNPSGGSPGRYSRRRPIEGEETDSPSVRRRPRADDLDDLARPQRDRGDRESQRPKRERDQESPRESGRYRPTSREQQSTRGWSADRFRRPARNLDDEIDDRSASASRDPYDRLRRVGNRPPRRVEVDPYDDLEVGGFDDYADPLPAARGRLGRGRPRSATPGLRQQQIRQVGALVANPAPEMRPIVLGAFLSLGSLLLLSLLLLLRGGDLDAWYPTRWNAEGDVTVYGTPSTAWRLPVFALFSTILTLGLGWWLRVREPFASQFLAVGVLLIHVLIWVSAITILW